MSPRSSKQLEEIRALSREKILDAALKLFAEKSFHSTSIAQIAKEAGVAKGLIYNYFEKKEDLITGIIHHELKGGDDMMKEMEKRTSAKEKLKYIIEASFSMIEKQSDHYKLLISLSLQLKEFPEIEKIILGKYEGYIALFQPLFAELGMDDAQEEARMLGIILDGIGMQYIVMRKDYPMEEMKQFLMKKYALE